MRRLTETGPGLDDDALRAALAAPTAEDTGPGAWVRVVFIASADGAATLDGRAGGLGSPADQRLLALSRHDADVVLVGAGTIRAEGYEGALLSEEDRRRRAEAGGPADPPVAVVSGSLDLDPESAFFTAAPVRPWILTSRAALAAEPERATALAARADVLAVGEEHVDPQTVVATLHARGARVVHCEGGPRLFGSLAAAGLVDEVHLTVAPLLAGPAASRVLTGEDGPGLPARLQLVQVLHDDGMLFLRLHHERHASPGPDPTP